MIAWYTAVWFIAKTIIQRLRLSIAPLALINISFFIAGLVVFTSFDRGECWFWLSGSATYLLPTTLLLTGTGLLLSPSVSPAKIVSATLCFTLAAGCNEAWGLVPLAVLSWILGSWLIRRNKGETNSGDLLPQHVFWPWLGTLLAVVFIYTAPGNAYRLATTPPLNIVNSLQVLPRITVYSITFTLVHRLPWLIMAFVTGVCLVAHSNSETVPRTTKAVARDIGTLTIALACAVLLAFIPSAVALQKAPPFRAWLEPCTFLVGYSVAFGYLCAQHAWAMPQSSRLALGVLAVAVSLGSCGLTLKTMREQIPIVVRYASQYDARYREATRRRDRHETREMIVKRLPNVKDRWINTYDMVENPNSWINRSYKSALHLPFNIRVEQNSGTKRH
jgi:hypothetical protein